MIPTSIRWTNRFTNRLVTILFLVEIHGAQWFKFPSIRTRGKWRWHLQTAIHWQRNCSWWSLLLSLVKWRDGLRVKDTSHTTQVWRVNFSQFIVTSAQWNWWSILGESFMSSLFFDWTRLGMVKWSKLDSINSVILLADIEVMDESLETTWVPDWHTYFLTRSSIMVAFRFKVLVWISELRKCLSI